MNTPTRIILIEDNPEYRNVIRLALEREEELILTHSFGTLERALDQLSQIPPEEQPDLILLDLMLPRMCGLEGIPLLLEIAPQAKIMILSQSDSEQDVVEAISLGASGYMLKSSGISQIKESIQTVLEGGAGLDVNVAQYILKALHASQPVRDLSGLTEREIEILTYLSRGLVKKEIADQLNISAFTVAAHVRSIYEKLQVPNAPSAISQAYQKGILK